MPRGIPNTGQRNTRGRGSTGTGQWSQAQMKRFQTGLTKLIAKELPGLMKSHFGTGSTSTRRTNTRGGSNTRTTSQSQRKAAAA